MLVSLRAGGRENARVGVLGDCDGVQVGLCGPGGLGGGCCNTENLAVALFVAFERQNCEGL